LILYVFVWNTGCGKLTSFFIWIYSYKKRTYKDMEAKFRYARCFVGLHTSPCFSLYHTWMLLSIIPE
jgi:hypothetical protein